VEGCDGDTFGSAGLCVPPMQRNALTAAMAYLCRNADARLAMGLAGQLRVQRYYRHQDMITNYNKLYEGAVRNGRNRV
jgi:hypothetical protein